MGFAFTIGFRIYYRACKNSSLYVFQIIRLFLINVHIALFATDIESILGIVSSNF